MRWSASAPSVFRLIPFPKIPVLPHAHWTIQLVSLAFPLLPAFVSFASCCFLVPVTRIVQ
jgi:hypothetical protein